MIPIYENAENTNDDTEQDNDIDSIVKTLMKDCEYSYLPLRELQKATNNSYRWNDHFSNSGPKYDGLLFVKIQGSPN